MPLGKIDDTTIDDQGARSLARRWCRLPQFTDYFSAFTNRQIDRGGLYASAAGETDSAASDGVNVNCNGNSTKKVDPIPIELLTASDPRCCCTIQSAAVSRAGNGVTFFA